MDVIKYLLEAINIQAALFGAGMIQLWKWFSPGPISGERSLQTIPGTLMDRLVPFIGPVSAFTVNLLLEWNVVHAGYDGPKIVAQDIVKGLLSGIASEYIWRVWYKTIQGV